MVRHSSKPVSGRVWKNRRENKTSALSDVKQLRTSFEQKMRAKADKTNMKQIVEQLMEEKSKKLEAKRKLMEANRKRREENTRKNEIVQVIKNTKKLKNIKKKHIRMIETR